MGAFQADGMPTVGMTGHAQELLGGLVFVELPDVSKGLAAGREAVAIEIGQGRFRCICAGGRNLYHRCGFTGTH